MSRDPATFPGYAVVRLAHLLEARMDKALRSEASLSVRQFSILAQLAHRPSIGSAELARAVLVTPQSMGSLIDTLEQRGLVVRRRQGGRGTRLALSLTESGEAALSAGYRVADRLREAERATLGAKEAQLIDLLDRLHATLSV